MPNWFNLLKRKDYPLVKSEQFSFFGIANLTKLLVDD